MEANLSLRPHGSDAFGIKVEIKNLNSFRAVRNALAYEIERQTRLLDAGQAVEQVTMGWLEAEGRTYVQRSKEDAHDYRYFPEPDLPPLHIDRAWVAELAASLPELPLARRARFMDAYALPLKDADLLAADGAVAAFYENRGAGRGRGDACQTGGQLAGRRSLPAAERDGRAHLCRAHLPRGLCRSAQTGGRRRDQRQHRQRCAQKHVSHRRGPRGHRRRARAWPRSATPKRWRRRWIACWPHIPTKSPATARARRSCWAGFWAR